MINNILTVVLAVVFYWGFVEVSDELTSIKRKVSNIERTVDDIRSDVRRIRREVE